MCSSYGHTLLCHLPPPHHRSDRTKGIKAMIQKFLIVISTQRTVRCGIERLKIMYIFLELVRLIGWSENVCWAQSNEVHTFYIWLYSQIGIVCCVIPLAKTSDHLCDSAVQHTPYIHIWSTPHHQAHNDRRDVIAQTNAGWSTARWMPERDRNAQCCAITANRQHVHFSKLW